MLLRNGAAGSRVESGARIAASVDLMDLQRAARVRICLAIVEKFATT